MPSDSSAPGTDSTAMNFRRSLPEIRCQSCLSPGSEPTPRGGFSPLPVAAPVYASDRASRCAPQDSGSGWIRCSFPVGLFHSRLHAGLSRRTACPTLTLAPAGGPRGALERPASDVIDLLLHGARERNDLHRRLDEILPRDLGIGEPRLGQSRHHALLDLGSAPTLGELRQLVELDASHVHPSPGEVNLEDLQAFLIQREVHEEDFVEAALAK